VKPIPVAGATFEQPIASPSKSSGSAFRPVGRAYAPAMEKGILELLEAFAISYSRVHVRSHKWV
jgi:hypothetical protein